MFTIGWEREKDLEHIGQTVQQVVIGYRIQNGIPLTPAGRLFHLDCHGQYARVSYSFEFACLTFLALAGIKSIEDT